MNDATILAQGTFIAFAFSCFNFFFDFQCVFQAFLGTLQ